ncbi:MAG: YgaP family membrane protein [Methylococcaceae bacterium]
MTFDIKRALVREFNVGIKDRNIRYGIGAAALLLSVFLGDILLLVIGGILVATAFLRWCPVCSGLSKSTVEACESPATNDTTDTNS